MTDKGIYEGIRHIVKVHTNYETECVECAYKADGWAFTHSVNHYISEHGYRLLHIGTESGQIDKGIGYYSVAFLGK